MARVAIIAAMPGELKPLVRGWRRERSQGVELWRWKFDEGEWIASCAGAGVDAATRAFAQVEKMATPDFVISIGWAGALTLALETGRVYRPSGVIDARTGERFQVAIWDQERWLITRPIVANEAEKRRLAAAYKADLVDMEAAGVARLAQMRGIPFYCFKGISDGYNDHLPDLNSFIAANGQFEMSRFVVSSTMRPWQWPALIRMGENSKKAAQSIAESVLDFLDEQSYIRRRNDYPNFSG